MTKPARMNTRLESEGAEFLVLGNLLIQGIPAFKAYSLMAGYDLLATNPELGLSRTIQVKSRWQTNANGFMIKRFDAQFLVIVLLNRGVRKGKAIASGAPQFFVFPMAEVGKWTRSEGWGKVSFKNVPDMMQHQNAWHLIRSSLQLPETPLQALVEETR